MDKKQDQYVAPTPYGPFPIEAFMEDSPEGVAPFAGMGERVAPILNSNGTTWEFYRRSEIQHVRQGFTQQWGCIFLDRDYPLAGHYSEIRGRQRHMPFYSYASLRRRKGFLANEADIPVGVLLPRSKGALQVLSRQCPVLAKAWEIMKLAPRSGYWGCVLPTELPAEWVGKVSVGNSERFREMWTHDVGWSSLGPIADDPVTLPLIRRAIESEQGENIEGAIAGVRKLIARLHLLDHPSAWAWCWISRLCGKVGNDGRALDAARSAIRADARNPECWRWAGMSVLTAAHSVRYLSRASALDPLDGELHVMCADAMSCIPRWEAILPHMEMAIRLDGDQFELWNRLGHALFQLGRIEESVMALERALELAPDSPVAWNAVAYLYAHVGRLEEAEVLCMKALAACPDNSAYLDTMGFIKLSRGLMEEARAYFARAVVCDSGNRVARGHLDEMP